MAEHIIKESVSELSKSIKFKDGDIIYFTRKFGFIKVENGKFVPIVGVHDGQHMVIHLVRGSTKIGTKSEIEEFDGDSKFNASIGEWDIRKSAFFSQVENTLGIDKFDEDENRKYYRLEPTTLKANAEIMIDDKLAEVESIKNNVKNLIRGAYR